MDYRPLIPEPAEQEDHNEPLPPGVSDGDGVISSISDELKPDDLRRAVQIPLRVRDAGFEANARR